jgi:hypothetical protein
MATETSAMGTKETAKTFGHSRVDPGTYKLSSEVGHPAGRAPVLPRLRLVPQGGTFASDPVDKAYKDMALMHKRARCSEVSPHRAVGGRSHSGEPHPVRNLRCLLV